MPGGEDQRIREGGERGFDRWRSPAPGGSRAVEGIGGKGRQVRGHDKNVSSVPSTPRDRAWLRRDGRMDVRRALSPLASTEGDRQAIAQKQYFKALESDCSQASPAHGSGSLVQEGVFSQGSVGATPVQEIELLSLRHELSACKRALRDLRRRSHGGVADTPQAVHEGVSIEEITANIAAPQHGGSGVASWSIASDSSVGPAAADHEGSMGTMNAYSECYNQELVEARRNAQMLRIKAEEAESLALQIQASVSGEVAQIPALGLHESYRPVLDSVDLQSINILENKRLEAKLLLAEGRTQDLKKDTGRMKGWGQAGSSQIAASSSGIALEAKEKELELCEQALRAAEGRVELLEREIEDSHGDVLKESEEVCVVQVLCKMLLCFCLCVCCFSSSALTLPCHITLASLPSQHVLLALTVCVEIPETI